MSMQSYPAKEHHAFYVDHVVTAHIMLALDKELGEVPEEIQKILDEGGMEAFTKAAIAYDETLDDNDYFCDAFELSNRLEDTNLGHSVGVVPYSNFDGTVDSTYPDRAKRSVEQSLSEETFGLILPGREESLFEKAYESPEELMEEYKHDLEGVLPDDFDWWAYMVDVDGTTFG